MSENGATGSLVRVKLNSYFKKKKPSGSGGYTSLERRDFYKFVLEPPIQNAFKISTTVHEFRHKNYFS